ncbi:hypothetical protein BJY24_005301 [Nocardia transvalensis]|uniref:Uncharacterized protein n=1 Tax=Nocardia transvalensis TaxID=37333 RepID=A0A7W9PHT2_9NOCA|nr:hypothetical protein [Nocardia transvalensis]MBB5916389.1 hypothetical protein [Nocardia transvalensis]
MTSAWAAVTAAAFLWLGMVLAISFLEAPLNAPRSHSHYVYIALEVVKVAGLLTGGILVLTASIS